MRKYVGIDLGTTTSGLAYLRSDGNPEIVPNADGERLTPSVVYFDKHEDVKLVGSAARDGGDPERTVFRIKRHMDDPDHAVDIDGTGLWVPYRSFDLKADQTILHQFPPSFSAYWVRAVSGKDTNATVQFTYE